VAFSGRVSAVNPNVDQMTRSVEVQSSLANADERLHPGMFARVVLDLGRERTVLTVPAASIVYAPYGNFVFTVQRGAAGAETGAESSQNTGTVRQQVVTIGERRGDLVSITQGLTKGMEVVSSAGFKLRPDAVVAIKGQLQIPAVGEG
jgi:membrane fusion protein (multidrug efflux system)